MDTPDDDDAYITDIGVGVVADEDERWVVMLLHVSTDPDPVTLFFPPESASTLAELLGESAMVAWLGYDPMQE